MESSDIPETQESAIGGPLHIALQLKGWLYALTSMDSPPENFGPIPRTLVAVHNHL